jgi:uncharacterized protein (DUF934 family)
MPEDDIRKPLFDLATATILDAQDRPVADRKLTTSDMLSAENLTNGFGSNSVIEISFDKFSDGRGFTHARRIRESGFSGWLVASGHVIADQADYLRRCGFSHAEISQSKIGDWQGALSAIPAHFQHMTQSPRSRLV